MTTERQGRRLLPCPCRLDHDPSVPLEVGFPKTIEWMRSVYPSGV